MDMSKTQLSMVSLGPSDWELVTIKALNRLKSVDAIAIPTKNKEGSFERSITFKIVDSLMKEYHFDKPLIPVYTPMKFKHSDWLNQAQTLQEAVKEYGNIAFVTLGDAGVYSTVYYLLDIIKEQNPHLYEHSEVIAGITSFSYASSKVKKPLCLGKSRLELIPLIGEEVPSTKIYMRPSVGMETSNIKDEGEMYTFENLCFEGEHIQKSKIDVVRKYMTLLIDFVKPVKGDVA